MYDLLIYLLNLENHLEIQYYEPDNFPATLYFSKENNVFAGMSECDRE
jgi:hypothetical protein